MVAVALLLIMAFTGEAAAQCGAGPFPGPTPACQTNAASSNPQRSSQAALLDVGGQFLQRIAALSSFRTAASPGNNPQGGGATRPTSATGPGWKATG